MLYSRMNVGDEAVPSMTNVGSIVIQRRRHTPLCYRKTNKNLLKENYIRIMLMLVTFEGRPFKAMREATGIPGEEVKPCPSIYFDFVA